MPNTKTQRNQHMRIDNNRRQSALNTCGIETESSVLTPAPKIRLPSGSSKCELIETKSYRNEISALLVLKQVDRQSVRMR